MPAPPQEVTVENLWNRVREGGHAALLGGRPRAPYRGDLRILRARCDGPRRTLGPLVAVRDTVLGLLGETAPDRPNRAGFGPGLASDAPHEAGLLDVLNRLAAACGDRVAVLLEAVESADPATLHALAEMYSRPGCVRMPIIIAYDTEAPEGIAAMPLAKLVEAEGDDAVFHAGDDDRPAEPDEPVSVAALAGQQTDVMRVLRAAAVLGARAEVELLADVLGVSTIRTLEALQAAVDAGVRIDDGGDGRVRIVDEVFAKRLESSTLPSLRAAWHRSAARILRRDAPARADVSLDEIPILETEAAWREVYGEVPAPLVEEPGGAVEPLRATTRAATRPSPAPDAGRAGLHLEAAGDECEAAARYIDAAAYAASIGVAADTIGYARRALAVLGRLPDIESVRRQRVLALTALARGQYDGDARLEDATLGAAFDTIEAALELLVDDDPAELRAEVAATAAAIDYDRGEPDALERAMRLLVGAARALQDAGDTFGAAQLLNEQAAIRVRQGDPVQAVHLLETSRRIFVLYAETDSAAIWELACTDHLMARLPLHVAARKGREADAAAAGLRHAGAALDQYDKLGERRQIARVWETIGRLMLLAGDRERACTEFERAVEAQLTSGDGIGLARSSAGLAEAMAAGGHLADALELIGDSIALNREKGSPVGLAYNRRVFEHLFGDTERGIGMPAKTARVAALLEAAEAEIGRVPAPETIFR